jgi:hypothetical protein
VLKGEQHRAVGHVMRFVAEVDVAGALHESSRAARELAVWRLRTVFMVPRVARGVPGGAGQCFEHHLQVRGLPFEASVSSLRGSRAAFEAN